MTWHADQTNGRPSDEERERLLTKRAKIESEIIALNAKPVGKTQAAALGRLEDLRALAKKITQIDRKLGR